MKRVAIMQPYFFPYIGYFQLMNAVDEFIIYDNIEYTKRGWINRNRILAGGKDEYLSITLKKDSDFLSVDRRCLADTWNTDRKKILNKISASYKKAPFYNIVYPIIKDCILFDNRNLFEFILYSIKRTKDYLEIDSNIIISSSIKLDNNLKSEKKVLAICKKRSAKIYINSIGGKELYSVDNFRKEGIVLKFIKTDDVSYKQYNNDFIPFLSIIDVMMFNSKEKIKEYLNNNFVLE